MDHGRLVGKSKQEGKGRMGRPRLRWLKDIENDVRKMCVKR